MIGFEHLPDVVFGPLDGRPEADWHRSAAGRWTAAQIAEHLAISLQTSSRKFDERRHRGPMARRPRGLVARVAAVCVLRLGWFPTGFPAPVTTRPGPRPDPETVRRELLEGHALFLELARTLLPQRSDDLLVKHPVLGDLTLAEWMRFHVVHCRHHAKQIRERMAS